jgi:hypothetical protein
MGDKSQSTGIMFMAWIVKSLLGRGVRHAQLTLPLAIKMRSLDQHFNRKTDLNQMKPANGGYFMVQPN